MPRKLIIDADPGIGDALAIALAALDPNIDLVGVTASSGCVSGMVATQNILTVMESVDPDKHPRLGASAASRPIFRQGGVDSPGFLDPLRLNGNYGLGTAEIALAQLHNQRESAKLMIDLVKSNPHEVTLLTLGPLTNVAIACELAPDFLDLLQRLVCLGGSVGVGGDVTAAAEFNIFADPISAQSVLQSAATRTLVPLDVSNKTVLSFDQFDRLKTEPTVCVSMVLRRADSFRVASASRRPWRRRPAASRSDRTGVDRRTSAFYVANHVARDRVARCTDSWSDCVRSTRDRTLAEQHRCDRFSRYSRRPRLPWTDRSKRLARDLSRVCLDAPST